MNAIDRPPLWRQLQEVAQVVLAVRHGQSGSAALQAVVPQLRPGVQALAFEVWRNLGRAQVLRSLLAARQPPVGVDALLCTALALAWRDAGAAYDAFTLVNQTVEAAKRNPALRAQAGFINACLRRLLRERAALVARAQTNPLARWNHPAWWVQRVQADWPDQWQAILGASAHAAPMVLRVNARWGSAQSYLALLQQTGLSGHLVGLHGVVLDAACAVQQLPGFDQGWVSVQDAGAQRAAPLLLSAGVARHAPAAPRVLDACAAPGGKTAHLLELSNAEVTALDVDPQRCARIHQNLERLHLQARVICADAGDVAAWWDGQSFDAILLDAPCTASGIVRRHPDIVWLRRPADVSQLAAQQAQLLARLWPLLRPQGHLLYCTCSVFRAEGSHQIEAFLRRNTDARLCPSPGHLLPSGRAEGASAHDNGADVHDGFFYALLQKIG